MNKGVTYIWKSSLAKAPLVDVDGTVMGVEVRLAPTRSKPYFDALVVLIPSIRITETKEAIVEFIFDFVDEICFPFGYFANCEFTPMLVRKVILLSTCITALMERVSMSS